MKTINALTLHPDEAEIQAYIEYGQPLPTLGQLIAREEAWQHCCQDEQEAAWKNSWEYQDALANQHAYELHQQYGDWENYQRAMQAQDDLFDRQHRYNDGPDPDDERWDEALTVDESWDEDGIDLLGDYQDDPIAARMVVAGPATTYQLTADLILIDPEDDQDKHPF